MAPPSPSARPGLSVVFPAYNDAGTIGSVVLLARTALRQLGGDFEILVVNDGSEDHTSQVLEELEELVPELTVIHHRANLGYGAALRTGFAAASKALVFYTDGDAQFNPGELSRLLGALGPEIDYVTGYRRRRADPWPRILVGRPYHLLVRRAFGLKVRDIDCDFRLIRREVLRKLELAESNGALSIELLKKLQDTGARFREVPVNHHPRVYGRSQYYTPRRVLRSNLQLFRLWVELVVRRRHMRSRLARPPLLELSRSAKRSLRDF